MSQADMIDGVIDSHCHLDFKSFDRDRENVIRRAKAAGVKSIVNSGVDYLTNRRTLDLSRRYGSIYPTLGLSPNSVDRTGMSDLRITLNYIGEHADEINGVGEAGLDYYRCTDPGKRQKQKQIFQKVIDLAVASDLPLVIHARHAEEEAFEMVRSLDKVVFHCYGGSLETMKHILERGFYVSLATTVCYSGHHQSLAKVVPLESLLLETDAPFLSPRRGRNEPSYVLDLLRRVAEIKEISPAKIAEVTAKNAERAFDL